MKKIAAIVGLTLGLTLFVAPAADATSWPPRHGGKHHAHHVIARDTQWGG